MIDSRRPRLASLLVVVGLSAVVGCASKSSGSSSTTPAETVDEGSDTQKTESDTESLGSSLVGGDSTSVTPASANELLGGGGSGTLALEDVSVPGTVSKTLYSTGCLTVTDAPATKTATYVFNGCTGPYGLVSVTGTVTVTYASSAANQLTLTYAATGLQINKSTIDWSATANITANGPVRNVIWNGKVDGTTGKGRAISRTNSKVFNWTVGSGCISVTGESNGTISGHDLKTDVIDFNQCKRSCPEAGSEIKITDETANLVYDVKWNALSATYTGPSGGMVTFTPVCAL